MIIATSETIEFKNIPEMVRDMSQQPKYRGKYLVAAVLFNEVWLEVRDSIGVHTPTSTNFDWYALNGKLRKFTNSQYIRDQNATPTLH